MKDDLHEPTQTLTTPEAGIASGGAPTVATFAPGEEVGERFRIVRLLGQGGMGQVFEAEDLELGTAVALKVIRPDLVRQKGSAERFKREIHLARQVTHPNVCRIFDLFQHRDRLAWGQESPSILFLTMELVRGETMAERLRREGPFELEEAFPLIREMAAALDAAHQAGVIHRDFKSSNVLLVESDAGIRVVVTDFGVAQEMLGGPRGRSDTTASGGGTPAYAAPEMVAGAAATPAADVYSFGVVIYEMLTGVLPFRGTTPQETARLRLTEDPPALTMHRPELDRRWEAAVLRCLRRRPDERFRHAGELAAQLAEERALSPRTFGAVGGAAALLAVLLVAALFLRRPTVETRPSDSASQVLAPAAGEPRTAQAGLPVSAEGKRLYTWGLERLRRYDLREASELLTAAAAAEPEAVKVHSALASCWSEIGWETRATAAARRAFEMTEPLPREERLLIEGLYRELARDWQPARRIYEELWHEHPEEVEHGLRLAAVETASGDPLAALATVVELRRHNRRMGGGPYVEARMDLAEAAAARKRGVLERQRRAAGRAAEAAEALDAEALLAEARLHEAEALFGLGRGEEARSALAQAREIFEERGDRLALARALLHLAVVLRHLPAERAGLALTYWDALETFREVGDLRGTALALVWLARESDEERPAQEMLAEALELARKTGDRQTEAEALSLQGARLHLSDPARSVELFEEAAQKAREAGNLTMTAGFLSNLAGQISTEDPPRSAELFEEALLNARQGGHLFAVGMSASKSARLLVELGQLERAERRAREALAAGREMEAELILAMASETLAYVYYYRGEDREARRLFETAAQHWGATGNAWMQTQLDLTAATLLGSPSQAEARIRELTAASPELPPPLARRALAQVLLDQGKPQEARQVLAPLLEQPGLSQEAFPVRLDRLGVSARIDLAGGNVEAARQTLEALVAEGDVTRHFPALRFRPRLALGRMLLETGDEEAGRDLLTPLAEEARALGFPRFADQAAEALSSLDDSSGLASHEEVRRSSGRDSWRLRGNSGLP